jgi:7,8-dihydropterin-6-yl-methyl-4-(beta-D-ribofuranosyl)aminobenzene 5'-phosphate synthase
LLALMTMLTLSMACAGAAATPTPTREPTPATEQPGCQPVAPTLGVAFEPSFQSFPGMNTFQTALHSHARTEGGRMIILRRVAFPTAVLVLATSLLGACGTPAPKAATFTSLYDNYIYDPALDSGWGFACLVETARSTVLFDTGASGESLLANMAALGKDPLAVDAVVLSHPHDDHTAGLPALLAAGARPKVYLLSSFPSGYLQMVRAYSEPVVVRGPMQIAPGISTTGPVSGPIPEQALIVETGEGLTVVTGCAHPGVVNMVRQAMDATGQQVTLVMGGFHLASEGEARIQTIIDQLRGLGVQQVGPSHCSGDRARALFEAAFGDGYLAMGVGRVVAVEP